MIAYYAVPNVIKYRDQAITIYEDDILCDMSLDFIGFHSLMTAVSWYGLGPGYVPGVEVRLLTR